MPSLPLPQAAALLSPYHNIGVQSDPGWSRRWGECNLHALLSFRAQPSQFELWTGTGGSSAASVLLRTRHTDTLPSRSVDWKRRRDAIASISYYLPGWNEVDMGEDAGDRPLHLFPSARMEGSGQGRCFQ